MKNFCRLRRGRGLSFFYAHALDRIQANAWQRVDSLILVFFRIVVALTIFVWTDQFLAGQNYRGIFTEARFLFKYPGLEWITLWPGDGMRWHFIVTRIAAIGLGIGLATRLCAATLCFAMAYVLLVECQIYVNHYYLLACMAGLLVFLPSGRRWSVDSWIAKRWSNQSEPTTFWRWQFWLLRFQCGMPYVFGAFAKLNGDWLRGQPGEMILRSAANPMTGGPISEISGAVQVFVWGGFLFDLLVVPMLLYRRTRWLAVILSLGFHLTNAMTLNIGVFPWFMLATLVVFFPADTLQRRIDLFLGRDASPVKTPIAKLSTKPTVSPGRIAKVGLGMAMVYVAIQLVLPTRPAWYAGDANWTEQGHRYAWRMMLRHKIALTHYLVIDNRTNDYLFLPSTKVLSAYQAQRADHHPELIRQTALQISKIAVELGVPDNRVYALALVSLNGRRPTPMVDPTVDLTTIESDTPRDQWAIPDPGPLLDPTWQVPKDRWWIELELPAPFEPLQGRTPQELDAYLKRVAGE